MRVKQQIQQVRVLSFFSVVSAGTGNSVVVKLLKAEYNRRAQLRPLLWDNTLQLPLENVYTRLKIVSRQKAGVQAEGSELNVCDIFGAREKDEDVIMPVELLRLKAGVQAEGNEVKWSDIFGALEKDEDVMMPVELRTLNAVVQAEGNEVNLSDIFGASEKGEDAMTLIDLPRPNVGIQAEGNKVNLSDIFEALEKYEDFITLFELPRPNAGVQTEGNEVNMCDIFGALEKDEDVMMPVELPRLKAGVQAEGNEVNLSDIFGASEKGEDATTLIDLRGPKVSVQAEGDEVNVSDNFGAHEKCEDVMTLVEGSPGIGKTTFCLKLAYDWANENAATTLTFPKFELVLLLKCRDIETDIMKAIVEQLLPEDVEDKTREKFLDFIRDIHNRERILIILDGLDELPQKSKHHVDKLLDRRILPFCYVVATTRQEKGIEVRKNFVFDTLLQIKGFTKNDSFEYIKKHFASVGPDHSSKGEMLIEEIKENTLLHALRNNPLNLLLLCVIYEDYEGKLPSSRSALYQIIVRCLLRRYCAKHNLEAHKDDKVLEKKFRKDILALGKLAWKCLLTDRYGFREEELTELESRNEKLVARELGLLYKEESLKRLAPQHEYCFLHKTFQEYLAASYIVRKLRKKQFNVFEHLTFNDLVTKYPQVFLFVSGILGEEASILFNQIGEKLQSSGHWNWVECSEEAATFFTESFNESGNAEKMAASVCAFIPFPLNVEIYPTSDADPLSALIGYSAPKNINLSHHFVQVLKACQSFSNLQQPVKSTVRDADKIKDSDLQIVVDALACCSQVTALSISTGEVSRKLAEVVVKGLSASTSLSEFALTVRLPSHYDNSLIVGKGLAASKTLTKATFELGGECSEAWVNALATGLSADTPLTSVVLRIFGSVSDTTTQALKRLLSNKSLTSLSLIICGDMQDQLAAALGKALSEQTFLNSLDVQVNGNLSLSGAHFLEKGLIENHSLNTLRAFVYGELPENWQTFVDNLRAAKRSQVFFAFHPDTCSTVAGNQVVQFRPVEEGSESVTEQRLTVNLWGELSSDGAKALCEALILSPLSGLKLNVRGKLSEVSAKCIARCLAKHKTLSSVTVLGELTKDISSIFQGLSDKLSVVVNMHDVSVVQGEPLERLGVSIDNPASLTTLLTQVKNARQEKLSVALNIHTDVVEEWRGCLRDCLSEDAIKALTLTINNYSDMSGLWMDGLGDSLAKNSSLNALTLTINNYSDMSGLWMDGLGDGLAKNTSLNALTLTINSYSDTSVLWMRGLGDGLAKNTSLNALTLTINSYGDMSYDWMYGLGDVLAKNTSLNALTMTINSYSDTSVFWMHGLGDGLAQNTSLNALTLTINNYSDKSGKWVDGLGDGLAKNTSLNALTLTINNYSDMSGAWMYGLGDGLVKNTSIKALTLTINNYSDMSGDLMYGLGDGLAQNTSLNALTLTINNYSDKGGSWMLGLGVGLAQNTSLNALTLTINSYSDTSGSLVYGLDEGLVRNTSIKTLTLTINNYSDKSGKWVDGLGDGLVKNTSIKALTLTINNYSVTSGDWMHGLGDGLVKNTSIKALTLTINNYSVTSGDWMHGLGDGLAQNTSLNALTLTINNYGVTSGDWMVGLGRGLAQNASLNTLTLTINNYSEHEVSCERADRLGFGLAKNKSLTTFNLTVNMCNIVSGDWLPGLCNALMRSESLTTLRLQVNNQCVTGGICAYDFSKLLVNCRSLALLDLTVSIYGMTDSSSA